MNHTPESVSGAPEAPAGTPYPGEDEWMRELVENAPDIISRFDRKLRHTYVNRAIERVTGIPPSTFLGKTNHELGMPAHLVELWSTRIRRVFDTGTEETFEFDFPTADGPRHFHSRMVPEFGSRGADGAADGAADGVVVSVLGVARDVTERVRLEAQLRHAQKMDAVGRLAGGIAHDFNNLLTVISTFSQFLLDGTPEADPRHADLAEIRKAADRAAALTRQLLAFSRRQVLQPRVLDVGDVVTGMEQFIGRVLGEDIELVIRASAAVPPVLADPGQLEQVVMNLALNARDAMPDGGVLMIETSAAADGQVRLDVRDTGVGMDADTQARALEPFFTTKASGAVTGLGLATAHGIVEQSGGRLTLSSAPGKGTTVTVHLPGLEERPADALDRVAGPVDATGGGETVLVVEDEEAVRSAVCRALRTRGYHVLDARDGAEGLSVSRRHAGPIHLLLTDVVMPAVSGPAMAERVAAERPGVRVMFMSGYSDEAIANRGSLGTGAVLIQKPFTLAELAHAVRMVLDADR